MEKGIETEESNLYKQTDKVAEHVLDSLDSINSDVNLKFKRTEDLSANIDYNKLFNILYSAFIKALNSCKLTLDEDGFARIVKNELYEVL
jgi:hypothetical protein